MAGALGSEKKNPVAEDGIALGELECIRDGIHKEYGRPNPPYYALLRGDGDSMGRAIKGLCSAGENREFSSTLSRFASKAMRVVEKHDGCPIYTGGDDVMALLPLHTILDCAEALRREFGQILANYKVTFSAGIAIAYASEPLSEVLRLARVAEARAKRRPGKDAVAFTVCPRSGANVDITRNWDLIPLLREIVEAYLAAPGPGRLSLGFAHELKELYARTPAELDLVLKELALVAASKKQGSKKASDLVKGNVNDRASLLRLADTMLVARPIYRAMRESRE